MKEISIEDEVFNTRLLLFIESEAQSNKYKQILLNHEEFKKVSLSIGIVTGKTENGLDEVEIRESEDIYDLPDLKEHE